MRKQTRSLATSHQDRNLKVFLGAVFGLTLALALFGLLALDPTKWLAAVEGTPGGAAAWLLPAGLAAWGLWESFAIRNRALRILAIAGEVLVLAVLAFALFL